MNKSFRIDSSSTDMRIDRWIKHQLGNIPQSLIEKNLRSGKIKLNRASTEKLTYHDPSNLSRTLNEVSAPRNALNATSSGFFEMEERQSIDLDTKKDLNLLKKIIN